MEAQVRMRELVRSRYNDERLWESADYGVYHSYRMTVAIMRKSNAFDASLRDELRKRLFGIIGRRKYIRYELRRKKQKVMNRIKRLSQ